MLLNDGPEGSLKFGPEGFFFVLEYEPEPEGNLILVLEDLHGGSIKCGPVEILL